MCAAVCCIPSRVLQCIASRYACWFIYVYMVCNASHHVCCSMSVIYYMPLQMLYYDSIHLQMYAQWIRHIAAVLRKETCNLRHPVYSQWILQWIRHILYATADIMCVAVCCITSCALQCDASHHVRCSVLHHIMCVILYMFTSCVMRHIMCVAVDTSYTTCHCTCCTMTISTTNASI